MSYKHSGDDRNLVEACVKKDLTAWSALISKYSKLIHMAIENRLKKYGIALVSHDIEDIRQNVLSDIWKKDKLKNIINRDNISYWLAIVAGNAAIAYARKPETKNAREGFSLDGTDNEEAMHEFIAADIAGADEHIYRKEIEEKIDHAIKSLPSKERLIIKLLLFHGKKHYEISNMLGMREGTVSCYIKRAKDKIKRHLKDFR